MPELNRRLQVGERVMTLTDLFAPPVGPRGARKQIPMASCGVVRDVLPRDFPEPYVVEFMLDEQVVEVRTTADDVVSVTLYSPEPLLDMEKHSYTPTYRRPHRRCRALHTVNGLLLCGVYGMALSSNTYGIVLVTVLVLLLMYGQQYWATRSWSWIPDILRREEPGPREQLAVNPAALQLVPYADVATAVGFASVLAYSALASANPTYANVGMYIVLAFAAFAVVIFDQVIHEKAVRIVMCSGQGDDR
jgi:uncharacterized membrane protein YiaA